MNIVGPSRLILLRSGKYDYGEVELSNPLHLVGPNNVGKTSLIAVLQFLYIDDQRSMHFSREMSETRKYYFPDQNSYILFECLTLNGYQVVGVQGLGPIRGYEFKRFSYQGTYDPTDFIDEARCVRPEEEIRSRLAAKEYRLLEPRHLRAALTGLGENRGVNLGLVPIRQRNHYVRFRAVFGNLLRLAHLRQSELKDFFLEIHKGELQQRTINLEESYANQYSNVCREAGELEELRTIADDVQRVLDLASERGSLRRLLPSLYEAITRMYAQKEEEFSRQDKNIVAHLERLNVEKQELITNKEKSEAALQEVNQSIGRILGTIERHQKEAEEFQNYLVDFEESRLDSLEQRMGQLDAALGQASDISLPQTKARIAGMQAQLSRFEKQRDQFSRLAAATILQMLPEEEIENAFKLINPDILGLIRGEEAVEFLSEQKIKEALEGIVGQIRDGVYLDDRIRLILSSLNPPDISLYHDAEILGTRIEEHQKILAREEKLYEAAENAEPLKKEKQELKNEWRKVNEQLIRYRNYQKELPEFEKSKQSLSVLQNQLGDLRATTQQILERQSVLEDKERSLAQRLQAIKVQHDTLLQRLRKLSKPDASWPVESFSHEGEDMESLLSLYERKSREHADVAERFNEYLHSVNRRTYDKYLGENESATLANLQAQVDALEERENAVEELWRSLVAGLQNAFKGLSHDLQTLIIRINELNRRLGRISISNLDRLRIMLREHPEWTRRIKTLIDAEIAPLFADKAAVSEAQGYLGDLLKRHQRVELAELFDLHFEVTSVDGQIRRYPHLDSIESNGTTITIKVLINLLLLKGLLGDKEVAIPFYLDEASSLDQENLTAIVEEAQKMGFIAVLASPDAMEAADSLYFLREKNGRIMLDPKTALVRIERKSENGG